MNLHVVGMHIMNVICFHPVTRFLELGPVFIKLYIIPYICGCYIFDTSFLGDMEAARSNARGALGLNIAGIVIFLSVLTIVLVMTFAH